MSLQQGKITAIESIKKAFERAAEMDGRSKDQITEELSTDIVRAVTLLIMSGEVHTDVQTTGTSVAQFGNGTGKVS